jgi:transcriptional regulator with AAA-type ATPase domain
MPKKKQKFTLTRSQKKAGWRTGTMSEFLGLSKKEEKEIEKRLEEPLNFIDLFSLNIENAFAKIIKLALEKFPTKESAASALGMSYRTFRRKVLKYNLGA